ncbi:leucyl aminopeptidase family protein [Mycoplasma sp. Pen4]|uniref:M17 family metallopeptidase n=1 Tax=Mycoplasma sp. Pen4 TaxID=640330 RepID=UPI00165464FF|nr:leucyl aminopeptidase family protein [Mycoplasma sp. Pen4]QNM93931.1 leucyl aminopeptidase family protein [Mycoplasma sp. Pen4]
MIKVLFKERNAHALLKAAYENTAFPNYVARKNGKITDNLSENVSYIYIDKKHQSLDELKSIFEDLPSRLNRSYQIDVESFAEVFDFEKEEVLRVILSKLIFGSAQLFKKSIDDTKSKKDSKEKENEISLLVNNDDNETKELVNKITLIAEAVNKTRDFQIRPENFLNSEMLAAEVAEDFSGIKNLTVKTLTKKEIKELGMGLLLSVNQGSTHEPRVVVISYNGDKRSKEHISIVGKGITFDTGGVNTKGYHMEGMKYDMSGSVIAAYAIKVLAELKAKVNVSAVMCITDNRINADASLPENIYQSMSGKWVEVVDTDAEGRLVLADGIYYAADKLKATTIIDVATLTGSMLVALGNTFTGIWSTNDEKWETFNKAANTAQEKVWRMPMHEVYNKGNKSSKVADLANWSSKVRPDSSQAAMFLKEFTKDVDFIHCDVAGTADVQGEPQGALIATLVEFALLNQK